MWDVERKINGDKGFLREEHNDLGEEELFGHEIL